MYLMLQTLKHQRKQYKDISDNSNKLAQFKAENTKLKSQINQLFDQLLINITNVNELNEKCNNYQNWINVHSKWCNFLKQ